MLAGLLAGLGFAAGLVSYRVRLGTLPEDIRGFTETGQFALWATLIALQPALWGAAAPWLWRENHELRLRKNVSKKSLALLFLGWAALSALIYQALTLFPPNPDVPSTFSMRNRVLLIVAGVTIYLPFVTSIWLIQSILGELGASLEATPRAKESLEIAWEPLGRAVFGELQHLRTVLQNLLLVAGVIIGAVTLATGALRLAVLAWRPKASFPPEFPLLYGGFFTVILAFIYVPAYVSLQRRARELIEACWPVPATKPPEDAWYKSRQNAEAALGLTTSVKDSFQTGAAILAPLLTSVVTILLPTKTG